MSHEQWEIERLNAEDRKVYEQSRKSGASHKFAMMVATQQPPGFRGKYFGPANGSLEAQHRGQRVLLHNRVQEAVKRGYKPNQSDVYCPDLANFPGDPNAYISGGQSEYNKKRAARDDMHKRRLEAERKANVKLAPDIVNGIAQRMIQENPSLKKKPRRELHEAIIDRHGAKD